MTIRLFGPFDARIGQEPLPRLRSRKGQWLLALLTLRQGRSVPRDWLAGTLWPESSDAQALANLRLSLTDLRRALGPCASRLSAPTPTTLCLHLADVEVDVLAFDAAIENGDAASLAIAVSLYRGPLLEGGAEEWILAERRAREQSYFAALETLASQAIARGMLTEGIQYLWRLVEGDPFSERSHLALMQALADSGDYAGMTRLYRAFRLRLHAEMHTEPSAEVSGLYRQLQQEARRAVSPSARLSAPSAHVPQPLSSFVGRANEIREVKDRLERGRLVTLTGAGGVGKTRLAIRVALEIAEEYSGGIHFLDLASLSDPALVEPSLAAAVGVRGEGGQPLLDLLIAALKAAPRLLIWDNCEHLIGSCVALAERLLTACPSLQLLATSRQTFGLIGEVTWRVPSLSQEDAVQLLLERARLTYPDFQATPQDDEVIAHICRRLDGIPLAIELAAARVRLLSLPQIASRLEDRFGFLKGGSPAALPRHQTLKALIDWSYDLLPDEEKRLLRRLAVFAGGWTLEAAEAVAEERPSEVLDLLASLTDKSLVTVQHSVEGETRYRLLETMRQYAFDRLRETSEAERMRQRHRDFFLDFAERAETKLHGPEQTDWLCRLEQEHSNFQAALDWSLEREEEARTGARLAGALWWFWQFRGHLDEGRRWLTLALERTQELGDIRERAKALTGAGQIAYYQSDRAAARALLAESERIYRALEDRGGSAYSLIYQGISEGLLLDTAKGLSQLTESVALWRTLGDKWGLGMALWGLGVLYWFRSDPGSAEPVLEESAALFREVGDTWGVSAPLRLLGYVAQAKGDLAAAWNFLEEAVAAARAAGDGNRLAYFLYVLADLAYDMGDYEQAGALYQESLILYQTLGVTIEVAHMHACLGRIRRQQEQREEARAYAQQAQTLYEEHIGAKGVNVDTERLRKLIEDVFQEINR